VQQQWISEDGGARLSFQEQRGLAFGRMITPSGGDGSELPSAFSDAHARARGGNDPRLLRRLVECVERLNENLTHRNERVNGVAADRSGASAAVSLLEFTQLQSAALRERRERLERAHLKQLAGELPSRRN
ncbi:Hypothetical protein, putative, partial [Bodo saltans]